MPHRPIKELLHDVAALRLRLSDLVIESATCFVPDGILERSSDQAAHFALRLHVDRLTWLSVHGCVSLTLEPPARAQLVELALGVLHSEDASSGVDTAVGRYVTTVHVIVFLPGLPGDDALPTVATLAINHYDHGDRDNPAWFGLLDAMISNLGSQLAEQDRAHLMFLRRHFEQPTRARTP